MGLERRCKRYISSHVLKYCYIFKLSIKLLKLNMDFQYENVFVCPPFKLADVGFLRARNTIDLNRKNKNISNK